MAQREPKSRTSTFVTIIGRDGAIKGTIDITSGNLTYKRAGARSVSGQWTLQQLVEALERDIEHSESARTRIEPKRLAKDSDFTLIVEDAEGFVTGDFNAVVSESHHLKKFDDERKLEDGAFQIDSPDQKNPLGFTWTARISVVTALYVIDLYIRKWLMRKRRLSSKNPNVPVSKVQVVALLHQWLTDLRG